MLRLSYGDQRKLATTNACRNGVVRIVQDDLKGPYDDCFEEAGQKNCTYKP